MKYPVLRFSTLARIVGAGYRVLARLDHSRSSHFERVWAMWTKQRLPFYLLLGRGRPQHPYLKGLIIYYLRKEMRPNELTLIHDDLFEMSGMKDWLK